MLSGYEVVNNVNKGTAAFDTHLHDCFEINFVLSDDIEIIIEDKMFLSKSGDIFIFPPYTFHKVDSKNKPFSRFVLFFNEASTLTACSALKPAISSLKNQSYFVLSPDKNSLDRIFNIFENACADNLADNIFDDYKKITVIGELLSTILPMLEENNSALSQKNSEILNILSYINQNFSENISIEDIALHFGMSQTTLWHMMKENIALSPKEYLIKTRLAKASELLSKGVSVTETAEKTGFNSYAHFIRIFTKYMGTSPYKYGKNN